MEYEQDLFYTPLLTVMGWFLNKNTIDVMTICVQKEVEDEGSLLMWLYSSLPKNVKKIYEHEVQMSFYWSYVLVYIAHSLSSVRTWL